MLGLLKRDKHAASVAAVADARRLSDWLRSLLQEMFRLMHHREDDNFDNSRYAEETRSRFFFELHAAYLSFLIEQEADFIAARALLEDEASQQLFDRLILFRLLGHSHVRLPFKSVRGDVPAEWKRQDLPEISSVEPIALYKVPYKGHDVSVNAGLTNVAASFLSGQYYFRDGDLGIEPEPGDHVIDGGGCLGDTALAFAADVGADGRIYTFDPLASHCAMMRRSFAMNPDLEPRIRLFEAGLAGEDRASRTTKAIAGIHPGARLDDDMPTRSIDSTVRSGEVARIDFIKMDIEGSELAALRGGADAIARWRPKLAISLYHRPEDFFTIPLWLNALGCGYRFFLRHYSIHNEETVLYGVAA
jgi:FkbM family methyltransferase